MPKQKTKRNRVSGIASEFSRLARARLTIAQYEGVMGRWCEVMGEVPNVRKGETACDKLREWVRVKKSEAR